MTSFSLGDLVRMPEGDEFLVLGLFEAKLPQATKTVLVLGECRLLLAFSSASPSVTVYTPSPHQNVRLGECMASGSAAFWPTHLFNSAATGEIQWRIHDSSMAEEVIVSVRSEEPTVWLPSPRKLPPAALEITPARSTTSQKALPRVGAMSAL